MMLKKARIRIVLMIALLAVGIVVMRIGHKNDNLFLIGLAVFAFLLIFALAFVRSPEDDDPGQSALDWMMGDMSDPLQRKLMFQAFICSIMHGVSVRYLRDIAPRQIDFADGFQIEEIKLLSAVVTMVLTAAALIWVCRKFMAIDDLWRGVYLIAGNMAGLGLVFFILIRFVLYLVGVMAAPDLWTLYSVYILVGAASMTYKLYTCSR